MLFGMQPAPGPAGVYEMWLMTGQRLKQQAKPETTGLRQSAWLLILQEPTAAAVHAFHHSDSKCGATPQGFCPGYPLQPCQQAGSCATLLDLALSCAQSIAVEVNACSRLQLCNLSLRAPLSSQL